jgi:hypothetical protein
MGEGWAGSLLTSCNVVFQFLAFDSIFLTQTINFYS